MLAVTAAQLTEMHRMAQLRLGARTVQQMHAAFAVLDPDDLDGSFADWVGVVEPIVQSNRIVSATIAANYLTAFRAMQLGIAEQFTPTIAQPVARKALTTSLLVTGPISIRSNLARVMSLPRAIDIARARSAAAAMRHVLNGGRETILETVKGDRRATGWQRVASGNACDFCSSLEDNGEVSSEDAASFEAHDGCACTAEPVYR